MAHRHLLRSAISRRRSGGTPPVVTPDSWLVRPELPFNVPDRVTLHSSRYKFYPHMFAVTDHRPAAILGAAYGNTSADPDRRVVYTVTNKALTSNTATLTTSAAHRFATGDSVVVTGVGSPFDGSSVKVLAVPTSTTFTYTKAFANITSTSATGTAGWVDKYAGNGDWFDEFYLPFPRPKSTDGEIPTGLASYQPVGGFWRDRDLRRANPGAPMGVKDREREVKLAYDAGYDGFFVESLYRGAAPELEVFQAVENLGLAGKFDLIPMIDYSGGFKTDTAAQTVAQIQCFLPRTSLLRINGKAQVAVFFPELKPVSFFQDVLTSLASAGTPIEFTFCYVSGSTYGTTGNATTYASVAVRHGRWGERDPTNIGAFTSNARGQAYANDVQFPSAVGRSLGYVAPGDERPKNRRHMENKATASWRTSWDVAINGNGQPSTDAPARADWTQLPTMNDHSEASSITATQNHAYNLLDTGLYYLMKAKTGSYPPILRDCLYLTHRIQFTTGMTYTSPYYTGSQTLAGGTANADIIEVLIFATAAGVVELTAGDPGTTSTYTVPAAGVYVYNTRALEKGPAGAISARMTRSGALVPGTAITSPWAVSHTNYSPDYNYRGGSSLRGWGPNTPAGADVPDQTHRAIT